MIRGASTAFAALTVASFFAGCGGGGGDNGKANTPTPAPTGTPAPTAQPAVAWAVGFTRAAWVVVRSRDAGASWETVVISTAPLMGVAFVDRDVGWAVGSLTILHTTDGGTTWTDQSVNIGAPHPSPLLYRVRSLDRNRAVAVGAELPSVGVFGPPLVLTTIDAGSTWLPATLPRNGQPGLKNSFLLDVCVAADGTIVTVGSGVSGNAVLLSRDFGATWADVTETIGALPVQIDGVSCVGPSIWIVGGGTTVVVHSSDAGQTWTDQTGGISGPMPNQLPGVTFVDALLGWALAVGPAILRTSDGGATWSRQTTPVDGSGGTLRAIAFAGSLTGIAVGADDTDIVDSRIDFRPLAFHTHDGGDTWLPAVLPADVIGLEDVAIVP